MRPEDVIMVEEVIVMKRDKVACHCRNITYGKIADAVQKGASSFAEVQQMTGCGKCCGKCREFLEYLVRDLLREKEQQSS